MCMTFFGGDFVYSLYSHEIVLTSNNKMKDWIGVSRRMFQTLQFPFRNVWPLLREILLHTEIQHLVGNARNHLFRPISPLRVICLIAFMVLAARSTFTLLSALNQDVVFHDLQVFSNTVSLLLMLAESLSKNFQHVHQIWIMMLATSLVKKPPTLIFKTHISEVITSGLSALLSWCICWYVVGLYRWSNFHQKNGLQTIALILIED